MDWQSFLGTAATIVALGSFAGLGLMRGTLSNLRESNTDLRSRVADLEKDRAEDRAELAEVKGENRLLKSMMTGRVEWSAIGDQLEDHHRQALVQWAGMNDRLDILNSVAEKLDVLHRDLTPKKGGQ